MRIRNAIIITALPTAVALLVSGCGSKGPSNIAAQGSQSPANAAFAFARCIRDHGVPDFPDPQVSTSPGRVRIRQQVPQGAASPAFKAAQKACAALRPGPRSAASSQGGPGKQALLAFARCLRAHGLTDFPDPNAQGQLTRAMLSAAGVNVRAPSFFITARKCVAVTHGAITMADVAAAASGSH